MRRGYIDTRRRGPNVLGITGWVLAVAIGAAFAWYALLGPGSSRAPATAEPTPTEVLLPTGTPTMAPTATPMPLPTATSTQAPPTPLPTSTSKPTLTPTPLATLVAGADGANVRSGPATSYAVLGRLGPGDSATITGRYEQWYQIDYEGEPAWVASWVVTATGAENVPEVGPPAGATPEGPEPAATGAAPAPEPSLNVDGYVVEGAPGPYGVDAEVPFWYKVTNPTEGALEFRVLGTWAQETNELFESLESVAPDLPLRIEAGQTLEGTGTVRLAQPGTYSLWLYVVLADDSTLQLAGPVTFTVE